MKAFGEQKASDFPWLRAGFPALVLAPMEGVTDAPMRALLTESGAFALCVSEFLRVSSEVPPSHVFRGHVPELASGCRTPSGVPVQIQLLGGDPEKMATTASRAVGLGALAIDINFGCPAATVNRHDGGATLLKFPDRIYQIISTIRGAVPPHIAVSAKFRLGWDSLDPIHENADRAADAGASWITIHGRTKTQGYAPPAYWGPIGAVNRRLAIPVVANGDIWTREDFQRCREESGCEHFMLGRGAMANPLLASTLSSELKLSSAPLDTSPLGPLPADWLPLLKRLAELTTPRPHFSGYLTRRFKQWLRLAQLRGQITWFDSIKTAESIEEMFAALGRC